jgi:hypothetical protein
VGRLLRCSRPAWCLPRWHVAFASAALIVACSGATRSDLEDPTQGGTAPPPGSSDGGAVTCQGGTPEIEPNNTPATANPINGEVCGIIDPPTESDFFTFTPPQTAKGISLSFTGKIDVTVTVAGTTVTLSAASHPDIPFVKGRPYVLEVKSADGVKEAYTVTVTIS